MDQISKLQRENIKGMTKTFWTSKKTVLRWMSSLQENLCLKVSCDKRRRKNEAGRRKKDMKETFCDDGNYEVEMMREKISF